MNVIPFNNRLYVEEIKVSDQKVGSIVVPEFNKDRRDLPKFVKVRILDVASNLDKELVGKVGIIETGFWEEVTIDHKIHTFCPMNYLVCIVTEDESK
jgi:hypothetical protein